MIDPYPGDGPTTIVGVFSSPAALEGALEALRDADFTPEQVSVLARETDETRRLTRDTSATGMTSADQAGAGLMTGGIVGGLIGWLIGVSALVVPGIGPLVGVGVLASTLAGATAGGLIGALASLGVPDQAARDYERHIGEGHLLLAVTTDDPAAALTARDIFDRHGGSDVRGFPVYTS